MPEALRVLIDALVNGCVRGLSKRFHGFKQFGVLMGHAVAFTQILTQVIQFPWAFGFGANSFPHSLANGDLLSEFPVKHRVYGLGTAGGLFTQ